MRNYVKILFMLLTTVFVLTGNAADTALLRHTVSRDPAKASLRIDLQNRSPFRVNPHLFGKFTEHLGQNIYNGIDAQILMNPTFGKWRFSAGDSLIDGGAKTESDIEKIKAQVQGHGRWLGLTRSKAMLDDYKDGAAFGWMRTGPQVRILLSPDVGPAGNRAQRIEVFQASPSQPEGLMQWIYLPLHRVRRFEFRVVARSSSPVNLRLSLAPVTGSKPGAVLASRELSVGREWSTLTGELEIQQTRFLQPDGLYAFAVTVTEPANVVLDRVLLYPADHVNYADPDVIRFFRDAKLPLMRWPGGNFVSGYHWADGVGPVDHRLTLPNPAWGGLEYNLFGTDEFVSLCKAIGCEPMICVNAGDGTPQEAAAWVEYCNGSKETSMGRKRSDNGHPEPYQIKFWEIGNEIFGRWQVNWTTPAGNADRYLRFMQVMKAADPSIEVMACGDKTYTDNRWNLELIKGAGQNLKIVTDHILTGGPVDSSTDPNELFHASMGYASQLGREYRDLRQRMLSAGIENPHLAITELQLFAQFRNDAKSGQKPGALTPGTMPDNQTISEALYTASIIHECIRMGDFVKMLTHSATVNHGGGLVKRREQVWANPSYYGHQMGIALANGTPVGVAVESATYSTTRAFGEMAPMKNIPVIDAVAVLSPDESSLILELLHRGAKTGPIALTLDCGDFKPAPSADILTLAGETMYARNTSEAPEKVKPVAGVMKIQDGRSRIVLPPFSLTRIILKK